jgi:flavin-dependent dehydrogenase
LLVGEAAGIDPVLGEGIAQAILYGEMAARFLARCWREQDYRFVGYRRAMRSARIGTDLRLRAPAAHLMYGPSRPWIERLVTSSPALAHAGMSYFAGEPVPRSKLARAALDSIIAAGVTLVRR